MSKKYFVHTNPDYRCYWICDGKKVIARFKDDTTQDYILDQGSLGYAKQMGSIREISESEFVLLI